MSENGTNGVNVANGAQPVIDENDLEDLERKEQELKRKERDPPIVFTDVINVSWKYPFKISVVMFYYIDLLMILNKLSLLIL